MTQGLELRGAVLGKGYRLGRRLDEGDETAYEATHERIPGRFLIRLFPPEMLLQPEASFRIQRGARVASLLRDPHAVQILDCNASGETPAFVVIERPQGQSLAALMAESGMLPLGRVVDLVDSLAAALAAGHQIGLVHGDLRPAHVILPTSGQPSAKLSGFGWAKELRAAARIPAPSGYLAPEQQFGKVLTLDERVDQFGLAALAYEMIAACLPFSEESADMAEIVGTPRTPPAIAELVPGIPKMLDEVLRRGLAFAPSERWNGVLELAAKLRVAAAVEPQATEATQVTSIPGFGGAVPAGAAVPGKPSSDVTEELDLATLAPVRVEDDIDIDSPIEDEKDDPNEDAKLVLGASSGPTTTDDAKTQIRRSPFFEEDQSMAADDDDDDLSGEDAVVEPPRRGLPVGRPTKAPPTLGNGSPGRRMALTPAEPIEPEWASSPSIKDRLSVVWAEVHKRRAWIFPAATGFVLLLIVGAMVLMSREPDGDGGTVAVEGSANQAPPGTPTTTTRGAPLALPGAAVTPLSAPAPPVAAVPPAAAVPAPAQQAPGSPGVARVESPPSVPPIAGAQRLPPSDAAPTSAIPGGRAVAPAVGAGRPLARPRALTKPALPADPPPTGEESAPETSPATTARLSLGGGPDDCSIRITSRPWAQVWIDGKNTGRKTPIDNLKVACGMRKLELKRPDKDIEQMEMLKVVPGKPYEGDYELQ